MIERTMNSNSSLPLILTVASLTFCRATRADLISDWSTAASTHITQNSPEFFQTIRGNTMVRVAMFDAANAALGGYTPYALYVAAPGASAEAAVPQAAYTVLTNLSQAGMASLNATLAASLATLPDGPAKDRGIQLGKFAAEAIIQLRAGDNPSLSVPGPSGSAIGKWRPTPPNFASAFGTQGRYLTPWTLRSPAQFRPGPPPALTSAIYTKDYNEIRVLGSRGNTQRTPEQAASAELREKGENWTSDVYAQHPLPLLESARREALSWMAGMDAQIQIWDAKYTYNFWRPVTAIRSGASDGNNDTPGEATWTPFLDTHNHPEYPSALVLANAATVEIMILLHGDNFSFKATSTNPDRTRTFAKLSDYVEDGITARVVGGTHFRNTCNVSADIGRRIARHAFQNYLRPVPRLLTGPVQPGEFTLFVEQPLLTSFRVDVSSDLQQWQPWKSGLLGGIPLVDANAGPNRQFFRLTLGQP